MILGLTIVTFVATAFVAFLAFYAFSERRKVREALKKVQLVKAPGTETLTRLETERRRSQRRAVRVPVSVCPFPEAQPLHEETTTAQVSAHGGLLTLAATVEPGQQLLLTNVLTHKVQSCRVVRVGPMRSGQADVGFEFAQPTPDFWPGNV